MVLWRYESDSIESQGVRHGGAKNIATILKQNVILVTTVHIHVYCLVDNTNKAQNYKDMVQKLLSYSAVFFFLATNVK